MYLILQDMKKIAIIGAGNMGGAIARGLTQSNMIAQITVSDINQDILNSLAGFSQSIKTVSNNAEAVKDADIVVLAVKPWLVKDIVAGIKDSMDYSKQMFISIAAGVSLDDLCALLDKNGQLPTLFRLIPNTAIDVLQSVNTIAAHSNASNEEKELVCTLFNGMGKTFLVPENQLNALMSLSSCGIAYAFRYIRAAVEGGVEMGIYPNVAKEVVLQTLRGAVELLEANNSHPEVEIDKVTTPGGITIKGLNEMEANGFTNAVIKGLKASLIK
ncbi:MAG: pyrroline-5-carboxylate reductase [Paludibacteraceae bacterium]|nr:pyrroline-5-carboxylate reductase [Paludibacteraceae bacterium]